MLIQELDERFPEIFKTRFERVFRYVVCDRRFFYGPAEVWTHDQIASEINNIGLSLSSLNDFGVMIVGEVLQKRGIILFGNKESNMLLSGSVKDVRKTNLENRRKSLNLLLTNINDSFGIAEMSLLIMRPRQTLEIFLSEKTN